MKQTILIELLTSLSESEMERLELFVESPFFNRRPKLVQLYKILKAYYPTFTTKEYSKTKVFNSLFPNAPYNNLLINEYYFLLSKIVIKFLKQLSIEKNEIRGEIDLLDEYIQRGLLDNFDNLSSVIEYKLLSEKFDHETLHLLFKFQAELINYKTIYAANNKFDQVKELNKDYNKFLLYLINLVVSEYISSKVIYFNDSSSFNFEKESLFKKIDDKKIILNLIDLLSKDNPFDFNIQLNLKYLDLIKNSSDSSKYYDYKNHLLSIRDKLKRDESELHLNYLKTYCIDRCYNSENREEFSEEYIKLEFLILEEKLFLNSKTQYLQNNSFRNLLIFLVNQKRPETIQQLAHYSKYLQPEYRNDFKYFALASENYVKRKLSDALKYLMKVTIFDKQIELDVDLLTLKIFFDQKNILKGMNKLHAVRRTLNNNEKIHEDRKSRYRLFLNNIERLFKILERNDEAMLVVAFKDILKMNNLVFPEWFQDKYEELLGVNSIDKKFIS